jgi:hypothetical protein
VVTALLVNVLPVANGLVGVEVAYQLTGPNALAERVPTVPGTQTVSPTAAIVGFKTDMVVLTLAVQLDVPVPTTEYTVFVEGETTMELVVAPVLHVSVVGLPIAVSVAELPKQSTGGEAIMLRLVEFTVTKTVAGVAVQF